MSVSGNVAKTWGVLVLSAATLATATACGLVSKRLEIARTEPVRITRITLEPGAGDITVRTAAVSDVEITSRVRHRGVAPEETYRIDGTELLLDTNCGRRCRVSYDVVAPEGVAVGGENGSGDVDLTGVDAVDIELGSGDLTVNGASGVVHARTGSGNLTVNDVSAAVEARTGSGNIRGDELAGPVTAQAGSGDIRLALDAPESVRASAASGSVDLVVPEGKYRVRQRSGSGSGDITVEDDPTATALLDVRTGSGNIKIQQD
ncbi:DUF4097 family beta strand repeat-containing protein [Actinopolymorpha alba]|uniref:DUF4097 family beta strand repeat-containing protein n=1 Tax=Actinopolymorpha alba TaxID=533267 RepID=UPI00037656A0|nr:DUF4097 family beta strand repeat-containing protein [Actinopolymorpha alba]